MPASLAPTPNFSAEPLHSHLDGGAAARAGLMMNVKRMTAQHRGSVELFKNAFCHVNFCPINPYDMSHIAIVS